MEIWNRSLQEGKQACCSLHRVMWWVLTEWYTPSHEINRLPLRRNLFNELKYPAWTDWFVWTIQNTVTKGVRFFIDISAWYENKILPHLADLIECADNVKLWQVKMSNKSETRWLRDPTIYRPAVHQKGNLFYILGTSVIKLYIINTIYGWLVCINIINSVISKLQTHFPTC
jgi:hypothetical protein